MNTTEIAIKAVLFFDGKILLLKRSCSDEHAPNEWDLPGGRLNFGETPIDALKREVKEETGIIIDNARPSRVWSFIKEDTQVVGITFIAEVNSNSVVLSEEHSDYLWTSAESLKELPLWLQNEIKSALA